MPEPRDRRVTFNIEATYGALAEQVANELGMPLSVYIRKVVVQDLRHRGKLTPELLFHVATADSVIELEQLVSAKVN